MSGVFGSFERNFIVVCCALSLIFFFPLLTIRAPMTGDQEVSGYDVFSRVNGLREDLDRPSTEQLPSTEQTPSTRPPTSNGMPSAGHPKSNPGAAVADLPFSVEISWLIPIFIAVAFLSAAVALMAAFRSANIVRVAATIGACFSAAAILHITVMNSDIHSWFSNSMKGQQVDKENPFAGLAEGLGKLIANAFQLKPGWGLYVLLVLLAVTAFLASSRLVSRLQIAPNS